jgi:hypothetical protein
MALVRQNGAAFHFQGKVEKCGQMTLLANSYGVGRAYSRQGVEAQLDAPTGEGVIKDEPGKAIGRHAKREVTYAKISQLQRGKRRKNAKTL